MKKFDEFLQGFSIHVEKYWSDVLIKERSRLRQAVVMAPPSGGSFDTSLVVKSSVTKEEILRLCIMVNLVPEFEFLKEDLIEVVWKRFFRPQLLYEKTGNHFTVSRVVDSESISAYLRLDKVNRETRLNIPKFIKCVGARFDNSGQRHSYLIMCSLLLSYEEGALERFLFYIFQNNLERFLFSTILNRNSYRKKFLFVYRGIDTRPVKKSARRRGYNDKGHLRDSTIPRAEPFPFALQELEALAELTKSLKKDLNLLQLKLADEVERSGLSVLTKIKEEN